MSKTRVSLQAKLEELLGTRHVYYQPPESLKLVYPCFVYYLADIDVQHADNKAYILKHRYTVTYMDKNPDTDMKERMLLEFPQCDFDRPYTVNGLHHFVFDLIY
jgi:hypothetical protein